MKQFLYFTFLFLFSSCFFGSIKGLKSGYKKLSKVELNRVVLVSPEENLQGISVSDTVYSVNANHLKELMTNHENTVVYFWQPNCSSDVCYPLHAVQDKCNENDQKLIVIMDYYDFEQLEIQNTSGFDLPIFSVNTNYYKTDFCNKYRLRFIKDLINNDKLTKEESYYGYFLFEKGQYVKAVRDFLKD